MQESQLPGNGEVRGGWIEPDAWKIRDAHNYLCSTIATPVRTSNVGSAPLIAGFDKRERNRQSSVFTISGEWMGSAEAMG